LDEALDVEIQHIVSEAINIYREKG